MKLSPKAQAALDKVLPFESGGFRCKTGPTIMLVVMAK
jgi:hypothetical protein